LGDGQGFLACDLGRRCSVDGRFSNHFSVFSLRPSSDTESLIPERSSRLGSREF
jgi:hypothetical protein